MLRYRTISVFDLRSRLFVDGLHGITPSRATLRCEVRHGVPYLLSDEQDQRIESDGADVGSDFVLRPRQDGSGSDLVIFGVIPTHTDPDPTNDLQAAGAVVLLGVSAPNDQTCDRSVRNDISTSLQDGCSRSLSGGYLARPGGEIQPSDGEGYLAPGYGAAAANPHLHALTYKPRDPKCDSCMRGKMRNLRNAPVRFPGHLRVLVMSSPWATAFSTTTA